MYPVFESHTKGEDSVLKKFYTTKACRTFWQVQYFVVATIWGYYVLLPTGWLSWHIGGDKTINEAVDITLKADPQMPYSKCPR